MSPAAGVQGLPGSGRPPPAARRWRHPALEAPDITAVPGLHPGPGTRLTNPHRRYDQEGCPADSRTCPSGAREVRNAGRQGEISPAPQPRATPAKITKACRRAGAEAEAAEAFRRQLKILSEFSGSGVR